MQAGIETPNDSALTQADIETPNDSALTQAGIETNDSAVTQAGLETTGDLVFTIARLEIAARRLSIDQSWRFLKPTFKQQGNLALVHFGITGDLVVTDPKQPLPSGSVLVLWLFS